MATSKHTQIPEFSVVIPLYNEENLLETAVIVLLERLELFGQPFEVILAENGSSDRTLEIAESLSERIEQVRALHSPIPDYGYALRQGILSARGKYIVCDEIDLGDMDFYRRALDLLDSGVDLVVGSKRHPQSRDNRPWMRRQGTRAINGLLSLTTGFSGTDTHGIKAFNSRRVIEVVHQCQLTKDLFASELVIRTERAGLLVKEIPIELREIRPPSIHLFRRVPRVLKDLARLTYYIRTK